MTYYTAICTHRGWHRRPTPFYLNGGNIIRGDGWSYSGGYMGGGLFDKFREGIRFVRQRRGTDGLSNFANVLMDVVGIPSYRHGRGGKMINRRKF